MRLIMTDVAPLLQPLPAGAVGVRLAGLVE